MEQSQRQTRSTSMGRRNPTTVDKTKQQRQKVSTEENVQVEASTRHKHRLSSAGIDHALTSKKLRQGQISQELVMKTTKAVIEKLLKEATSPPKSKRSRKPKRKGRSNTSPIACTFSQAASNCETLLTLDFSGPIEADGAVLSSDRNADSFKPDDSNKLESDSSREGTEEEVKRKAATESAAEVLRKIGDSLDEEVKKKISKVAIDIVKRNVYKTYRDAVQALLEISQQQPADQLCERERYQIALVWLLTEKTITEATKVMASATEVSGIVDDAASFISETFPSWLNPWM